MSKKKTVNSTICGMNDAKKGAVTFLLIIFFIGEGFIILQTKFTEMSGAYVIQLNGLKDKSYRYLFQVGADLFAEFEGSEIDDCDVEAVVHLEKSGSEIGIALGLTGSVLVNCDRCLGEYRQQIEAHHNLLVKRGDSFEGGDPDIVVIPGGSHDLDLKQMLYDFINTALPLKRVHPEREDGTTECDPEMLSRIRREEQPGSDGVSGSFDELGDLLNDN